MPDAPSPTPGGEPSRHRIDPVPELANERVRLRRVVPDDIPVARDLFVYDGVPAASDLEAARILRRIEQDVRAGESLHWGICIRGTRGIVGTCGFYRGYPGNVAELGYHLRQPFRGRGIMTSAVGRVVTFGRDVMRLDGIVAYVDHDNRASAGVLERTGFRLVASDPERLTFSL